MFIDATGDESKNVKIVVEKDVVDTSFEKWGQPGHFSRTLAKGPKTTTWIWDPDTELVKGLEPPAYGLQIRCSTIELHQLEDYNII